MKEEEKYIASLFEKASREEAHVSFEEVAHKFEASLYPSLTTVLAGWFFKNLYLNSIIILISIAALSFTLMDKNQVQEKQAIVNVASNSISSTLPSTIVESKLLPNALPITTEEPNENKKSQNQIAASQVEKKIDNSRKEQKVIKKRKATKLSNTTNTFSQKENKVLPKDEKPQVVEFSKENSSQNLFPKEVIKTPQIKEPIQEEEVTTTNISSRKPKSELSIILETALNVEVLKEDLFVKNSTATFQQLILLTNGKFDRLVELQFEGKKVIILKGCYEESFNLTNEEFINVQEINIEGDKADIQFIYNAANVLVELEKINDIWTATNTKIERNQEEYFIKKELMQLALDSKKIEKLITRKAKNEFKPFAILANNHLLSNMNVQFNGERLHIVQHRGSYSYSMRSTYIEITEFQIKRKKAILQFSYKGKEKKIVYHKKHDKWVIHSFK